MLISEETDLLDKRLYAKISDLIRYSLEKQLSCPFVAFISLFTETQNSGFFCFCCFTNDADLTFGPRFSRKRSENQ